MRHECKENIYHTKIYFYDGEDYDKDYDNSWIIELDGDMEAINYCPYCGIKLDKVET